MTVICVNLTRGHTQGCYFTQEQELKLWENEFFERTKWGIEENITLAHGGGDGSGRLIEGGCACAW